MAGAAGAAAQQARDPAVIFGAREAVEQIDLSPDGRRVVYLTPGPGPSTAVVVQDLAGGAAPRIPLRSDGDPERVRWCRFAGNERLVCRISALIRSGRTFMGFQRLLSFDLDGNDPRLLARGTFGQFDGSIIDWLPDQDRSSSLMAQGGGVRRLDVRTLNSVTVESSNASCERVHDRRTRQGAHHGGGDGPRRHREWPAAGSPISTGPRTAAGGGRWGITTLSTGEGRSPLAVDPTLERRLCAEEARTAGCALYRVKLDGIAGDRAGPCRTTQVDVDDVVAGRRGRG